MRVLQILKSTALVLALATAVGSRADDTDIYLDINPSAAGDPFLMLILDWRPDVIGSNACTFHAEFSTDNTGCDKRFGYGPIGHMIRHVNNMTPPLTRYAEGQSIAPADAFRAVFSAFLLGYDVVKRNADGTPIAINGTPCPETRGTETPDACFNTYPGAGKPDGAIDINSTKSVCGGSHLSPLSSC